MRNGESTSKDLSIKCLLITKGKKGKESLPRREGWQEPSKPRDQMSEHHQKWDGVAPRALSEDTEGGSRHHHFRCLLITRNVDPISRTLQGKPQRDTQQNNGLGSSKESGL